MVYYKLSDYTGNWPTYQQCVNNVLQMYRDKYVIPRNGAISGYTMFPEGMYMDYIRGGTNTAADLTAIDDIAQHAGYMSDPNGAMVPVRYLQRETTYVAKTAYYASLLNNPVVSQGLSTSQLLPYYVSHVIGHLDQICASQNAQYYETFMVGLEAEFLTTYYSAHSSDIRDPRRSRSVSIRHLLGIVRRDFNERFWPQWVPRFQYPA
jgi:hypothetical protein